MKILSLIIISLAMSSCAMFLSEESAELITEKRCRETCLVKNKIYMGYDEDFGCYCQNKE